MTLDWIVLRRSKESPSCAPMKRQTALVSSSAQACAMVVLHWIVLRRSNESPSGAPMERHPALVRSAAQACAMMRLHWSALRCSRESPTDDPLHPYDQCPLEIVGSRDPRYISFFSEVFQVIWSSKSESSMRSFVESSNNLVYIKSAELLFFSWSIMTFYKLIMELSRDDLIKLVHTVTSRCVKLKRRDLINRNPTEIFCNIEISGSPQKSYVCCCLCKAVLKLGQRNKTCRNRHIAKH